MESVFKIKLFGLKRLVRFVKDDEQLELGDLHTWCTKEEFKENPGFYKLFETACAGETPSEHKGRIYIRVVR